EGVGPRRAQDRPPAVQDPARALGGELDHVAVQHAPPPGSDADHHVPVIAAALAHDGPDHRVQAGAVAAAGQDPDPRHRTLLAPVARVAPVASVAYRHGAIGFAAMERAAHVLAIDAGTTGVRAMVVDASGAVVTKSYREFPQSFPRPGWVEHDPDAWWAATLAASSEALRSAGVEPSAAAAVGSTNQRETTV